MQNSRALVLKKSDEIDDIVEETEQFLEHFQTNSREDSSHRTIGVELEAWIVDNNNAPIGVNRDLLKLCKNECLVEEILKFNLEYNSPIFKIENNCLSRMHRELESLWKDLNKQASYANCSVVRIGTLPTLETSHIKPENISENPRYTLLNDNIMREIGSDSFNFEIKGDQDEISMECRDILIEGSTTSLQIHTNLPKSIMPYYYDASCIASASLVSLSGNSPYLFQKQLWEETRISIFENAIKLDGMSPCRKNTISRVGLGTDYCNGDIENLFRDNVDCFTPILPSDSQSSYSKVKTHNGTIWRWIRPVIGENADGSPHIRVEQRVCASSPSTTDDIANIAYYLGLSYQLALELKEGKNLQSFEILRKDFYEACKYGLEAKVFGPIKTSLVLESSS